MLVVAGATAARSSGPARTSREDRAKDKTEKLFDFDKAQAKEIKLSRDGSRRPADQGREGLEDDAAGADRRRRKPPSTPRFPTALAGLKQK